MTTDNDVQDAAALRDAMTTTVAARCGEWGFPLPVQVEAAFRAVPRHLFAPEVSLEAAYAVDIVEVKRSEHGALISTMSAPDVQAMQLVQTDISPGMRVLEIGSGGYFASLLSELVGPTGQVTSMDIDPDVTSRAHACLDAAGYPQVRVVTADAEHGWEADAPYDRIMVTVGAWDIPSAWREQLAKGGRIVVPLRMKGITRSLALERTNDHLVSLSQGVCGFVKMQGVGAHDERLWPLKGEKVGLRFDDGNLADPHKLDGVLAGEPAAAWSGVTVARPEPFPDLPLWMATALPGFCNLTVNVPEGEDPGIVSEEGGRWFPFATVEDDSFAYLSGRPAGEGTVEFGAHGYGPHGGEVAQAIVEQIQVWDRDYRGGPGPQYEVWPIDHPVEVLPKSVVIAKQHTHVAISWPDAGRPATGVTADNDVQDAAALRSAMVRELRDQGAIQSESVAAAFATVPRHLFTPGEPLNVAYAVDNAPIVKRNDNGLTLSSVSAPHLQATMLEAADIKPSMHVCEVGSGGYNAALLAELVGDSGRVTTVDIDPEIVERAGAFLHEAGYDRIHVVLADAEQGVPMAAPFDRIIVTAGSWDIPPAWIEQLADDGRMVVPLRLKGTTRWIAFDRDGSGLVSRSYGLCVFVPFQGAGSHTERNVTIDDGVVLRLDDENLKVDRDALRRALHLPRIERWSGAVFDMPDEQALFLLTNDPNMALLYADQDAIDQGLLARPTLKGLPVLISDDSFAYRAARQNDDMGSGYESGVYAHGPSAEDLAARYMELLRQWASKYHRRGAASIQYIPKPANPPAPSSGVIAKRHGTVVVTWP
ncbi:methyltransferase, FxLD system [Nonomuraea phyllanthi]|uniref:methyltransferase, FxLD system n=1 Tax=Nonomuraea phyllanthi TaxID=2219224 RepID=UPI001D149496|nr:methyltransferase, FxLD system [Nonomuraea phyllanthi]